MNKNKRPLTQIELEEEAARISDCDFSFTGLDDSGSELSLCENDPGFSSSNSDENSSEDGSNEEVGWMETVLKFSPFEFTGLSGILTAFPQTSVELKPIDIFKTFINQEAIQLMVVETNRYAKNLADQKRLVRSARISRWYDTNEEEIYKFIGKV